MRRRGVLVRVEQKKNQETNVEDDHLRKDDHWGVINNIRGQAH